MEHHEKKEVFKSNDENKTKREISKLEKHYLIKEQEIDEFLDRKTGENQEEVENLGGL
jgi:hypothetical protein